MRINLRGVRKFSAILHRASGPRSAAGRPARMEGHLRGHRAGCSPEQHALAPSRLLRLLPDGVQLSGNHGRHSERWPLQHRFFVGKPLKRLPCLVKVVSAGRGIGAYERIAPGRTWGAVHGVRYYLLEGDPPPRAHTSYGQLIHRMSPRSDFRTVINSTEKNLHILRIL